MDRFQRFRSGSGTGRPVCGSSGSSLIGLEPEPEPVRTSLATVTGSGTATPGLFDRSPRFDGPSYDPALDHERLTKQLGRVFECMRDGQWRTLNEIADATGDPHASISAQLRHLRKPRFGGHQVDKRRRGIAEQGCWEYRLVVNERSA